MSYFSNPFKNKPKSSAEIVLKKKIECLIFIGDNTLDNFYGLNDHSKNIEYILEETLTTNPKPKNKLSLVTDYMNNHKNDSDVKENEQKESIIKVYNFAYCDNMTCDGILNGVSINELYIKARQRYKSPPYPLNDNGVLHPLQLLSSMLMNKDIHICQKNKDKNHINPTVILCVGMCDLRNNLKYGTPDLITESLRKEHFAEKFEKIIHQIIDNLGLNLIILIPNEPHESFMEKQLHFSRDDLLNCMEYIATKMMQIAEKYRCPMIDMSRTVNTFNREHYGVTAYDLSEESGQFLVDLLLKVLSVWDWNDKELKSKIFYGCKDDKDGIQEAENNKAYRSNYFNSLQSKAMMLESNDMDLLADLFQTDD